MHDTYKCKCGQLYIMYVPKKLILEKAQGFGSKTPRTIETVGKIDEKERKSEEIEILKKSAKDQNAKFIDVSVNRVITCDCKRVYDPLSFLKKKQD